MLLFSHWLWSFDVGAIVCCTLALLPYRVGDVHCALVFMFFHVGVVPSCVGVLAFPTLILLCLSRKCYCFSHIGVVNLVA
jgi:hypothetical protein